MKQVFLRLFLWGSMVGLFLVPAVNFAEESGSQADCQKVRSALFPAYKELNALDGVGFQYSAGLLSTSTEMRVLLDHKKSITQAQYDFTQANLNQVRGKLEEAAEDIRQASLEAWDGANSTSENICPMLGALHNTLYSAESALDNLETASARLAVNKKVLGDDKSVVVFLNTDKSLSSLVEALKTIVVKLEYTKDSLPRSKC